jgi:hypothetical protein
VTRALSLGSLWGAVIAAASGTVACNSTSNAQSYTPITGIEIQPSSLLQGLECGTGPNDVYQYVAVVWDEVDGGPSAQPIASNVFDCFATGLFENLPTADGGSQQFFLRIFGYSQASLPPDLTCPDGLSVSGGVCPAQDASLAATSKAPWVTTCNATQQQGIPVLAVCLPFQAVQPLELDSGAAAD